MLFGECGPRGLFDGTEEVSSYSEGMKRDIDALGVESPWLRDAQVDIVEVTCTSPPRPHTISLTPHSNITSIRTLDTPEYGRNTPRPRSHPPPHADPPNTRPRTPRQTQRPSPHRRSPPRAQLRPHLGPPIHSEPSTNPMDRYLPTPTAPRGTARRMARFGTRDRRDSRVTAYDYVFPCHRDGKGHHHHHHVFRLSSGVPRLELGQRLAVPTWPTSSASHVTTGDTAADGGTYVTTRRGVYPRYAWDARGRGAEGGYRGG